MLVFGTQMHVVTFIFVCIDLVILFYLIIYRLARPDVRTTFLNIILISLLITYNITGGLLPDPMLPGSFFVQECIAYGTGFITPCYFPYYVYKAFKLERMKFHAYRGIYLFLIFPYLLFVFVFALSNHLGSAKNILIIPVVYASWVIISLRKAIKYKYSNDFSSHASKEETAILFFSLTPWVGLPVISFFDLSQAAEALTTNSGFLLLLALHLKRTIKEIKDEHQRLIASELRLLNWNNKLEQEVERRTKDLKQMNEQKTHTLVNLAHETKTPLTLINNYLDEYIQTRGNSEELTVIKRSVDKLTTDILNLFDLERINKGISVFNHDQVSNFTEIIRDNLCLFQQYASRRKIEIKYTIEEDVFIRADPVSINRIINNLLENAIKFSKDAGKVEVSLESEESIILFKVQDYGTGIPSRLHKKIFEPYYQIANHKSSIQGMGLGLPIVKKVIEDLYGTIAVESHPGKGTKMVAILNKYILKNTDIVATGISNHSSIKGIEILNGRQNHYDDSKQFILIVEDNIAMTNYLLYKLGTQYNVYAALNGNEALNGLKDWKTLPDLIISDVMMDKVDGYTFAKILSNDRMYNHIPFIFLTAKSSKNDRLLGLRLGAIDFIQKPFSIDELLQKIQSVLSNLNKQRKLLFNGSVDSFSNPIPLHSNGQLNNFDENCRLYKLTSRERDIARLICTGFTHKRIAKTFFIAERTVAKHAQNIFEKVKVSNKVELCHKLEK